MEVLTTMKKYILNLTLALLLSAFISNTSFAGEEEVAACSKLSKIAELIMTYRQQGRPVSELINSLQPSLDRLGSTSPFSTLTLAVVEMAYGIERYADMNKQNQLIETFRDEMFLMCYKEISNVK